MNELDEVKIATAYTSKDGSNAEFGDLAFRAEVIPEYASLKGWKKELNSIREYNDLPIEAKDYVSYIEKQVNVPIRIISVGPERNETIFHS
jgi:adenylosuccinate synthase